jgi:hypothetical protein
VVRDGARRLKRVHARFDALSGARLLLRKAKSKFSAPPENGEDFHPQPVRPASGELTPQPAPQGQAQIALNSEVPDPKGRTVAKRIFPKLSVNTSRTPADLAERAKLFSGDNAVNPAGPSFQ